ncbi:O-antigen ligase family protein [Thermus scotoductus]|uniref:O-antigen ligase family protein n=1 Tax=Thermus scotoductus TaxID=37636 RepID=UPI000F7FBF08|nr:hypothetical protein [Thermus scotoductus]
MRREVRARTGRVLQPAFGFFLLGFSLAPFYFWQSGLPQPAHALLLTATFLAFIVRRKWAWCGVVQTPLLLFVVYSTLINVIVWVRYGDLDSLLSSFYYAYNFLVFWGLQQLIYSSDPRRIFSYLGLVSVALLCTEILLYLLGKGRFFGESRFVGTFNDPNQLAHWILWSVIIVMVMDYTLRRKLGWLSWSALLLGFIILLASASRSGLLGFAAILLAVAFYVTRGRVRLNKTVAERWLIAFVAMLLVSGAVTLVALLSTTEEGTGTLGDRLTEQARFYVNRIQEGIFTGEANLEERGYDRLWKFPEYLLLGAGEGANDRWADRTSFLGEIHSTLAGVAFYYGIPGTALLLFFIVRVWIALPHIWLRFLLLAPLLYSLGTYNLRNTMFWLGMAIMWAAARELRRSVST